MGISNFVGIRYTMFDKQDSFEEIANDVAVILEKGLFTSE